MDHSTEGAFLSIPNVFLISEIIIAGYVADSR